MASNGDTMAEIRAFMKSRTILTAAELDLFSLLYNQAMTVEQIASDKALDERALTRLLDVLVTFGLMVKKDGSYETSQKAETLSSQHPETILPMVLHLNHLWGNWSHLTESIRRGFNPARRGFVDSTPERLEAFIEAMHVVGRDLAEEIAEDVDLSDFRSLMDIGSGSGTYTAAFLRRNPALRAVLFDLENVIPLAERRMRQEGLGERVQFFAGNYLHDELPSGCDVALLSAIIHQNSPNENRGLFLRILKALEPGGVLIIRDHIMDEDRTNPPDGALFALNMLVNTKGGDTYTLEEIQNALEEVGFEGVELARRGERMDCLVMAKKPVQSA